jgi:arylsulfatase A-like enzyme
MRFALVLIVILFGGFSRGLAAGEAKHVILMVWDGMRPDFVSEENTPTLFQLAQRGVTFSQHHSVYLSTTEVNGAAIMTGNYPRNNGLVGNHEYRRRIDPIKSIRTENLETVRKGDQVSGGRYLRVPTLAEIVRSAGGKAVVAGTKPVALLADRAQRTSVAKGMNVFAGSTLPAKLAETVTARLGQFPAENATNATRNDWTTDALLQVLWADGVPNLSILWVGEPDWSQHQTGPGSAQSLAGMRNSDSNLAKVLNTLEANGALSKTDILIVSDHGCSTIARRVDLVEALKKLGLRAGREYAAQPQRGDILVVSNSGSLFIYVADHEEPVTRKVVAFLRTWDATGVIFTRRPIAGAFALSQVQLDSEDAPDIVVSFRWTAEANTNGTRGMLVAERTSFVPGQGLHGALSPFDLRNTLIAAGPDFRAGVVSTLASGNVDVAPTILWILGIKPETRMDGRVLSEGLSINAPRIKAFEPHHIEASYAGEGSVWRQYLNYTTVNGVIYLEEGNGNQRGQ